jgi:hypothetical protein
MSTRKRAPTSSMRGRAGGRSREHILKPIAVHGNQSCQNGPLTSSTPPNQEGLRPGHGCKYHEINGLID